MIVIQLPLLDLLLERVVFRNRVVPTASRMRMARRCQAEVRLRVAVSASAFCGCSRGPDGFVDGHSLRIHDAACSR
jgi:hypothetical protein